MPSRPRPQVADLQQGPQLQQEARPVDTFQFARDPQYRAHLTDFAALSTSLARSLSELAVSGSDEEGAAGVAAAQKDLETARAGSESVQQSFAKAVGSGTLQEDHNPYFFIGYRKAIARAVGANWANESLQAIEDQAGGAADNVDPKSGVAPPIPDAVKTSDQILQSHLDEIKKVNPDLINDPWFQRTLTEEKARLGPRIEAHAAQVQGEASRAIVREALATELGKKLDTLSNTSDPAGAVAAQADLSSWVTANLHRGGIKDPHAFMYTAVRGAYFRIQEQQGAEAASDFLRNASKVPIGNSTLASGQHSDEMGLLLKQGSQQEEVDRDRAHARLEHDKQDNAIKFLQSKAYQSVLASTDPVAASAAAADLVPKILAEPAKYGVDPRFAADTAEMLSHASLTVKSLRQDEIGLKVAEADRLISNGKIDDAEAIARGMPGPQMVAIRGRIEEEKKLAPWLGSVRFQQLQHQIDTQPLGLLEHGTQAGKAEVEGSLNELATAFQQEARALLRAAPEGTRDDVLNTQVAALAKNYAMDARAQVANASEPYKKAAAEIRLNWQQNKDSGSMIHDLLSAGAIDEVKFNSLMNENRSQVFTRDSFQSDQVWQHTRANLTQSILSPGNFSVAAASAADGQLGGVKASGPLIDAGYVVQTNQPTGMSAMISFGGQPSAHVQLTPKGLQLIDRLMNEARSNMNRWQDGPEAVAAKAQSVQQLGSESQNALHSIGTALLQHATDPKAFEKPFTFVPDAYAGAPDRPQPLDTSAAPETAKASPEAPAAIGPDGAPDLRPATEKAQLAQAGAALKVQRNPLIDVQALRDSVGFDRVDWGKTINFPGIDSWVNAPLGNGLGRTPLHEAVFTDRFSTRLPRLVADFGPDAGRAESEGKNGPAKFPKSEALAQASDPTAKSWIMHPYPVQLAVLQRYATQAPDREQWKAAAEKETGRAIERVKQSGFVPDDVEWAAYGARQFLGIPYQDVLKGMTKFGGTAIALNHPEWIRYPIMPLFRSTAELQSVMGDDAKGREVLTALGISHRNDIPLSDQAVLKNFVTLQRVAISRIN